MFPCTDCLNPKQQDSKAIHRLTEIPVKRNMAYVRKSVQELKAGKGTAHELIEAADE